MYFDAEAHVGFVVELLVELYGEIVFFVEYNVAFEIV